MARKAPRIPLPADWPSHVRIGIVHVISLAQVALTAARGRSRKRGVVARLRAKVEEQAGEITLLKEEFALKDLRMGRVKPRRRPHYRGVERLRILELKAARGWSKVQASTRFFLRPATLAEWTKRVDENGESALLQAPKPINRFPDFVRHIVMRLKVLCPTMGKKRIAQTLARAGLALGVSTVGRMLKERERKDPEPEENAASESSVETCKGTSVEAKGPNHVWQVRPHSRSNRSRILGAVAAALDSSALAIFVADCVCRRSLLSERDGIRPLQERAEVRRHSRLPWSRRELPWRSEVHDL